LAKAALREKGKPLLPLSNWTAPDDDNRQREQYYQDCRQIVSTTPSCLRWDAHRQVADDARRRVDFGKLSVLVYHHRRFVAADFRHFLDEHARGNSTRCMVHSGFSLVETEAVARGLRSLGAKVVEEDLQRMENHPTNHTYGFDVVVVCALCYNKLLTHHVQQGAHFLVTENGYLESLQRRKKYRSLSLDGLNGRAAHYPRPHLSPERAQSLGLTAKPWRVCGKTSSCERILIIGQMPLDTSLTEIRQRYPNGTHDWYDEVVATLRRTMPGKRLVLRLHPQDKVGLARWPEGAERDNTPRRGRPSFNDVYCVVTMSSTVGVHAVLAGVPTVAVDQTSMTRVPAHTVSLADLTMVPDIDELIPSWQRKRPAWVNFLAHSQWSVAELASGEALKHALAYLPARLPTADGTQVTKLVSLPSSSR